MNTAKKLLDAIKEQAQSYF